MTTRIMVLKLDATGRPCAWGTAPTEAQAREEANRQLRAWVARQHPAEVFSPFTEEVKTLEIFEAQAQAEVSRG